MQAFFCQVIQLRIAALAQVIQKTGNLGIVDHAHQRDPKTCREDQGVQAHGDHRLHFSHEADDQVTVVGGGDHMMGTANQVCGSLADGQIPARFQSEEDGSQAVVYIKPFRFGGHHIQFFLDSLPRTQDKHGVFALGIEPL